MVQTATNPIELLQEIGSDNSRRSPCTKMRIRLIWLLSLSVGVVASPGNSQTYELLHVLNGATDGDDPPAGLVLGSDGYFAGS